MIPRPTWLTFLRHLLHAIRARIVLVWHCFCALCFALCLLFTVTWPAWLLLVGWVCGSENFLLAWPLPGFVPRTSFPVEAARRLNITRIHP